MFSDTEVMQFRQELTQACAFSAQLNGRPAGAGMFVAPYDGLTELTGITTLAPFRRQGIASALTAAAAQTAFAQGIEAVFLSAATEEAGRIYERLGFQPAGALLTFEDEQAYA
jgi:ribosomal protein S18 acetylase RimI-like enzyme